jgi:uncharacterized membrane protein YbaN (DUF454 family)
VLPITPELLVMSTTEVLVLSAAGRLMTPIAAIVVGPIRSAFLLDRYHRRIGLTSAAKTIGVIVMVATTASMIMAVPVVWERQASVGRALMLRGPVLKLLVML